MGAFLIKPPFLFLEPSVGQEVRMAKTRNCTHGTMLLTFAMGKVVKLAPSPLLPPPPSFIYTAWQDRCWGPENCNLTNLCVCVCVCVRLCSPELRLNPGHKRGEGPFTHLRDHEPSLDKQCKPRTHIHTIVCQHNQHAGACCGGRLVVQELNLGYS